VAQQILATDVGDPLLAAWQYGLGRAVAWTSDATGRWATQWVAWPDFARFWSQAIRWTITEGVNQNVEVRVQQDGEHVRVVVDALANDGSYLNGLEMTASVVSPDLSSTPLALHQVAPGRYEATFYPGEEGAYFVRVAAAGSDGQAAVAQTSGWVLTYSPEYRSFEGDPDYLAYLARLTGGTVVEDPATVFAHNLRVERASQPVWPWLLLMATVLLPFDIAVRRLVITRSDWARLLAWLGVGRRRVEVVRPRASRVGSLLDVKDRVSRETRAVTRPAPIQTAAPSPDQATPAPEPTAGSMTETQPATPTTALPQAAPPTMRPAAPAPRPASSGGTVSSLLKSKRVRRGEDSDTHS